MFKSHLYGIEITNTAPVLSTSVEFKSNLYGIEISYGLRMLYHLLDFFIAPLWNNDDLYSTWYCGGWRPPLLIGS